MISFLTLELKLIYFDQNFLGGTSFSRFYVNCEVFQCAAPATLTTCINITDQLKELHRLLSDPNAGGDEIIPALVNIVSLKSYDVRQQFLSTYNEDLLGVLEGKFSKEAFKVTEYLMLKYLKASSLLLAEAINVRCIKFLCFLVFLSVFLC